MSKRKSYVPIVIDKNYFSIVLPPKQVVYGFLKIRLHTQQSCYFKTSVYTVLNF